MQAHKNLSHHFYENLCLAGQFLDAAKYVYCVEECFVSNWVDLAFPGVVSAAVLSMCLSVMRPHHRTPLLYCWWYAGSCDSHSDLAGDLLSEPDQTAVRWFAGGVALNWRRNH